MNKAALKKSAVFLSLGFEISGAIAISAIGGYYLDEWLSTAPLFMIVLVIASFVAVFWRVLRILSWLDRREE